MKRTGLNRNFALSLFDSLFHGFPEYVSGRIQERDADRDSCLNAVLFLWFNIEHHFDGKSTDGVFSVFLRNKYDWSTPEGLAPEQIIETESESRTITMDFNLTNIPPVPDMLHVLNSLHALSLSSDRYKDPYDWKWYTEENKKIFKFSKLFYVGFLSKEEQCRHVFESLQKQDNDFEGLPWDRGEMTEAQRAYIRDLRAYFGLDRNEYKSPFLSQIQEAELENIREIQLESVRANNDLIQSKFEAEYGNKSVPVSDKYTEQEFREAWRTVLNSPNLSDYWKGYQKMKNWDLLTDDYVMKLLEQTLDEFRKREYKSGIEGACKLWIHDLKQPLDILGKKAPCYSSYVNTQEELSKLGKLSEDEVTKLQIAGVLERAIKEPRDYFNLSDLLYKAEFFEAYCTGLSSKYKRQQDTPEMQALRMRERQMHWEKMGKYLVNGFKPKTDEQETQAPESFKKSIIIRLRDSGLITASKYQKEDKHFYYYVTEQFTPKNIKACLLTDRIKWQTIAEFKAIIPEPYKKESNYTPVPMDATTLQRTAYNKARSKK